jgi:aminomethyltransferase
MSSDAPADTQTLLRTPLDALHRSLGARMVPFAGYEMPVQYPTGIIAEHEWTRSNAGLFDVSHMGQGFLVGPSHEVTARALEALCPADIMGLAPGRQRYTQFLAEDGGILDDLMVTRSPDPADDGALMLVVNAGRKEDDFAHLEAKLPASVRLMRAPHRGLLALQGPKAAEVIARHAPDLAAMRFMDARSAAIGGIDCAVTRSGYTGEDGYEISVHVRRLAALAELLLREPEVKPIGLGARDSLRLEAGLCLYGHDIDTTTSPVEAALVWSMQKRRREEGGFPGFERVRAELADGPSRLRAGLLPEGRQPAREGTEIQSPDGRPVGTVTSGGFGPTVNGPVAMGYVETPLAAVGTQLNLMVRGKALPARVVALPFVPNHYAR